MARHWLSIVLLGALACGGRERAGSSSGARGGSSGLGLLSGLGGGKPSAACLGATSEEAEQLACVGPCQRAQCSDGNCAVESVMTDAKGIEHIAVDGDDLYWVSGSKTIRHRDATGGVEERSRWWTRTWSSPGSPRITVGFIGRRSKPTAPCASLESYDLASFEWSNSNYSARRRKFELSGRR